MPIRCGSCGQYHPSVAAVKACSASEKLVPSAIRRPLMAGDVEQAEREMQRMEAEGDREESLRDAAAKVAKWDAEARSFPETWQTEALQGMSVPDLIDAVRKLLTTKVVPESEWRWSRAIRRYINGTSGVITDFALRTAIARLEAYRNIKPATPDADRLRPVEVEGLYRLEGRLYQVVRGKDSGQLYAKLVTFPPKDSQAKRPTLTYARGVIFDLTPADLLPAEEAQEITRRTGWCVFGHFLTNPKSIARGMGPVCWARYGAPAAKAAKEVAA